jgi:hypothetical protein
MSTERVVEALIDQGRVSRRGFLRLSAGAAGAAGLVGWWDLAGLRAEELRRSGRACIVLWMAGGPSQLETFDPKPEHPNGGPTQAIETAVSGIRIAEHWPRVAREMESIALIRSMTNREGNHQRATYQLHTGYIPSGSVKYPSFGSVVAQKTGDEAVELPHFVVIGQGGQDAGVGAGILGARYEPFRLGQAGRPPANVASPVEGERLKRRLGLLKELEAPFAADGGERVVEDHRQLYERAARLVLSPHVKAFDLDLEPAAVREAYGSSGFGQGCLLARRLVEAGVPFVEVGLGGWDTHQDNFERSRALSAQADAGFAQLVRDLKERGLLDRTLVVWMGEFGRTPRINPRSGRDHFPRAFCAALAGGGVKGGQVVGSSSPDGMEVSGRPVSVPDLFCSLAKSLGIDPRSENLSPLGRPVKVVDGGSVVSELF